MLASHSSRDSTRKAPALIPIFCADAINRQRVGVAPFPFTLNCPCPPEAALVITTPRIRAMSDRKPSIDWQDFDQVETNPGARTVRSPDCNGIVARPKKEHRKRPR